MAIVIPHRPKYRGRLHYIYYLRGDTLCLRTRPTSVADPRTPAQIAQRLKMRLASHFLSGFKPFVEQGFAPAVKENFRRVGAYHCALSHLMRNALVAVDGGMIIDTSRVCLAEGRDNPMLSPKARLEGRSLRITWQGGLPRGCREVLVGLWNRDKGKAKCYNFIPKRLRAQYSSNCQRIGRVIRWIYGWRRWGVESGVDTAACIYSLKPMCLVSRTVSNRSRFLGSPVEFRI